MKVRRFIPGAIALSAVLVASALPISAASAAPSAKAQLKSKPLSQVIAPASRTWNSTWDDYNVVSHAVFAVLKAKPSSDVAVLADGNTRLTAFLPTDRAFQRLVKDLTGKTYNKEQNVYKAALTLGVPTIEQVLLYHVVPGARITKSTALKANNVKLATAQGATIKVKVTRGPVILLVDKATRITNPRVLLSQTNINLGNKQLAHGINRVLLPIPLKPKA